MASRLGKRLPGVKTLYEVLPKGSEGGKEFSRIVDLLLFHEARRKGHTIAVFNDAAGDYYGLDSFERSTWRRQDSTGYQYKFYPSPLSTPHRQDVIRSLKISATSSTKTKLKKWILITPEDLTESSTRTDGGDVTWFESLHDELNLPFELDHWKVFRLILISKALILPFLNIILRPVKPYFCLMVLMNFPALILNKLLEIAFGRLLLLFLVTQ
jgi:hypothetical protein